MGSLENIIRVEINKHLNFLKRLFINKKAPRSSRGFFKIIREEFIGAYIS